MFSLFLFCSDVFVFFLGFVLIVVFCLICFGLFCFLCFAVLRWVGLRVLFALSRLFPLFCLGCFVWVWSVCFVSLELLPLCCFLSLAVKATLLLFLRIQIKCNVT